MAKTLKPARYKFQYAVKFICVSEIPGTSQQTPSLPAGSYQTAVNIHNPRYKKTYIRMKLAAPEMISPFKSAVLGPDGVKRIVCRDVPTFLETPPIHGFEGFLVIESTHSIDVVGVYSAAKGNYIQSWDIEQIKERKL